MTTLLLAECEDTTFICARRLRLRDRICARLLEWRLDRLLAEGASPDSTPALSLRARKLIGLGARGELARSLRRIQADARRGRHPFDPTLPLCRTRVVECESLIAELTERLLDPAPVAARGVAQARLLVTDGSSPLYTRAGAGLEAAIEEAMRGLVLVAGEPV
jgi:hypothetical protein